MQSSRVLVVEDDDVIREALELALGAEGFATAAVASVASAIEQLDGRSTFGAVVLDLMLTDGSGEDVLEELAERDESPAVVVVSASHRADEVARRYGVALVKKPFDLDALIEAIASAAAEGVRPRRSDPGPGA
jgi:DNA-binding NtrC family response regulator